MTSEDLRRRNLESEFIYSTSRSGGPGGQNVNKLSTKVELRFNISASSLLTKDEKDLLYRKLKNKINKELQLVLVSQAERSQIRNKNNVTEKFYELVAKALTRQARRKSTRPTLISEKKRLENKKIRGAVKRLRKTDRTEEI